MHQGGSGQGNSLEEKSLVVCRICFVTHLLRQVFELVACPFWNLVGVGVRDSQTPAALGFSGEQPRVKSEVWMIWEMHGSREARAALGAGGISLSSEAPQPSSTWPGSSLWLGAPEDTDEPALLHLHPGTQPWCQVIFCWGSG